MTPVFARPRSSFVALPIALVASALATQVLAACSDAAEVPPSQEQETRVSPDGSDLPASVRVLAPNGAPEDTVVELRSKNGKLGEVLGPLSVEKQEVKVLSGPFASKREFTPSASATTTIRAALLTVDTQAAPTFGLVQGRYEDSSARRWTEGGAELHVPENVYGSDGRTTKENASAAILPGTYRLSYELADGVEFEIDAGKKKTIAIAPSAGRRIAKIVAPTRELPTARCASAGVDTPGVFVWTQDEPLPRLRRWGDAPIADGASLEVGAASWHPDVKYMIRTTGTDLFVPLPLGAPGKGPLVYKLGRLDVDDVAVTQPDGSKKRVAGTYAVWTMIQRKGTWVEGEPVIECGEERIETLPTNTGIDLPVGKYKLRVTYETAEAGKKTNEYTVDVK